MNEIQKFKQTMSCMATGVSVVTGGGLTDRFGVTISSFTSVSLDPLLVLFCLNKKSRNLLKFKKLGSFMVNILEKNQSQELRDFADPKCENPWKDLEILESKNLKLPILKNAIAFVECEIFQTIDAGDHEIIIGKALSFDCDSSLTPLIYYHGAVHG